MLVPEGIPLIMGPALSCLMQIKMFVLAFIRAIMFTRWVADLHISFYGGIRMGLFALIVHDYSAQVALWSTDH